ncbi:MAG: ATP-binding protein, partial [Candidatus Limnocylindria bacterium]|nr:ATP-binding protein [Candidatus Limnocylindria bacterium]
ALLMELFAELRPRAAGRLSVNAIDAVAVRGSSDRLKQLLLIVLDNALRYTPAPGRVYASLRRDATEAIITVEDEGIGVSAAVAGRAFERFYRGDDARRLEPSGSGLGLAIARWIAGQHGGTITLSPREPAGTIVEIRLHLSGESESPPLVAAVLATTATR